MSRFTPAAERARRRLEERPDTVHGDAEWSVDYVVDQDRAFRMAMERAIAAGLESDRRPLAMA